MNVNQLHDGDHIFIQRYSPLLYTHHGIVVHGNKNPTLVRIAHPVKMLGGTAKFSVTGIYEFIGDLSFCVNKDINDPTHFDAVALVRTSLIRNPYKLLEKKSYEWSLPVHQIVRNALTYVKQNTCYCLLSNNCEMFAEYCCTGKMSSMSRQVLNNVIHIINGNTVVSNINTAVVNYVLDSII